QAWPDAMGSFTDAITVEGSRVTGRCDVRTSERVRANYPSVFAQSLSFKAVDFLAIMPSWMYLSLVDLWASRVPFSYFYNSSVGHYGPRDGAVCPPSTLARRAWPRSAKFQFAATVIGKNAPSENSSADWQCGQPDSGLHSPAIF